MMIHFPSSSSVARDYYPRGRDCNDSNAKVYPGRKIDSFSGENVDYNCNGISGIDSETGKSKKEVFCQGSKQLGVILLGDAFGSNFHISQSWFDISQWKSPVFADLLPRIQNMFSVPQYSGFTGTCPEGSPQPCRSVYKYLSEWNRCNIEDYANSATFGTSVPAIVYNMKKVPRKRDMDHPALVFFEVFFADVCFDTVTPTAKFREGFLSILKRLDDILPNGSHLVVIGLIEDDVYERMHKKLHPSGVTYEEFYRYSDCLKLPFCHNLLRPNQEERQTRLDKARELNQVYQEVLKSYFSINFDSAYYDFPMKYIEDEFAKESRDSSEIYDAIDGFHLSQKTNAILADYFWNSLKKDHADWIGPENPFNKRIEEIFI